MAATSPRARLKKSDASEIAALFTSLGYRAVVKPGRVEVYLTKPVRNHDEPKGTEVYVGGFYWRSAGAEVAGAWHFYLAFAPLFSHRDLQTAASEIQRVQRVSDEIHAAWGHFVETKSDKRWTEYRGQMARMFLRQDPETT